ncbi:MULTISPECIES: ribonuclease P protein component [Chromobacterium]|uniref:Ribonuclease P protein component n=1 Tax=Chromobacterium aquaticum TaxID=467180 RepID=A0ABV8ZWF3_9NEIS|nr:MULTISPECIES: ribonuclease P protein component [Chromobacterium]KMN37742.1 ribonuclease P [Chromobacterium sp. LK1]MCD5361084.1 ribonuclease P protein component [Chromobacterium aquaticum]
MSAYRFRRAHRLLKTDEFSSVFSLRLSRSNATFQVSARPNELGHARLGLVVGRKVHKRAVRRNYIKRTVREWFRLNRQTLPDMDFVVRAKVPFTRAERTEVITALSSLFAKLARCRVSSSS